MVAAEEVVLSSDGERSDCILDSVVVDVISAVKDITAQAWDIAPRIEKSGKGFTYEGVMITPVKTASGTDLRFTFSGHTVLVKNYTKSEFDRIFGL